VGTGGAILCNPTFRSGHRDWEFLESLTDISFEKKPGGKGVGELNWVDAIGREIG